MKPSTHGDAQSLPKTEFLQRPGGPGRLLSPVDRITETLYGVIITLTFTCTIEIAEAQSAEKKLLLYAAIGCNIAWGIVDGVMYVLNRDTAKRYQLHVLRLIRKTKNTEQVREIISQELSSLVGPHLETEDLDKVHQALLKVPVPSNNYIPVKDELLPALGIFIFAVISAIPVILPFIFIEDTWLALRVSNGIAILVMFCCGWLLGRYEGGNPWLKGFLLSMIGIILVIIALALGG